MISDDAISDLYKDAYGFRPDEYFYEEWYDVGEAAKQQIWDNLIKKVEENERETLALQTAALDDLKAQIALNKTLGASTDLQAMIWVIDEMEVGDSALWDGADYLCYLLGLAYKNELTDLITEAMNEVTKRRLFDQFES